MPNPCHKATRPQGNNVRTQSSAVTLPWAPAAGPQEVPGVHCSQGLKGPASAGVRNGPRPPRGGPPSWHPLGPDALRCTGQHVAAIQAPRCDKKDGVCGRQRGVWPLGWRQDSPRQERLCLLTFGAPTAGSWTPNRHLTTDRRRVPTNGGGELTTVKSQTFLNKKQEDNIWFCGIRGVVVRRLRDRALGTRAQGSPVGGRLFRYPTPSPAPPPPPAQGSPHVSAGVGKPPHSECASGCPWSTARATARLRDSRPPE